MPCLDCGVPTHGKSRCPTHEAIARGGTTTQRGYGRLHQVKRKTWEPLVATGKVRCRRCGRKIKSGETWHLGHNAARTLTHPEHEDCNVGHRARR